MKLLTLATLLFSYSVFSKDIKPLSSMKNDGRMVVLGSWYFCSTVPESCTFFGYTHNEIMDSIHSVCGSTDAVLFPIFNDQEEVEDYTCRLASNS